MKFRKQQLPHSFTIFLEIYICICPLTLQHLYSKSEPHRHVGPNTHLKHYSSALQHHLSKVCQVSDLLLDQMGFCTERSPWKKPSLDQRSRWWFESDKAVASFCVYHILKHPLSRQWGWGRSVSIYSLSSKSIGNQLTKVLSELRFLQENFSFRLARVP